MSVLDVSKCKNSYITSILDNKKSFDDRNLKTLLTFSITFLLTLVGLTTETTIPVGVNHNPSFYLRVNYAESIYLSVTSHEIWTFIGSMNVRNKSFRSIQCTCHYFENYQRLYIKPSAFLVNASLTSGNFRVKLKLARITPTFKKGSRFDKDN